MSKRLILAGMALLTAGLMMLGAMGTVLAADLTPVNKAKGTLPTIPAPDITVSQPRAGNVFHRNGWMVVGWKVTEPLMADPRFELKLLKGRAHTVVVTLPSGGRIDPPRSFQATWRVSDDIVRGGDYFVQVKHLATGKKGFSKLFFME